MIFNLLEAYGVLTKFYAVGIVLYSLQCFRIFPARSARPPTRGSVTLSTPRCAPRATLVSSSAPSSPRSSAGRFIVVVVVIVIVMMQGGAQGAVSGGQ